MFGIAMEPKQQSTTQQWDKMYQDWEGKKKKSQVIGLHMLKIKNNLELIC